MPYRGSTLILDGGRVRIQTSDVHFNTEFEYGKNEAFLKVFLFSYVKLLSDSPLSQTLGDKPLRVYIKFFRLLQAERLDTIIKFYSVLADRIMSTTYETGSEFATTGEFVPEMISTPIFKEYHQWYKTGDPSILRYVLTFLRYGKKLRYIDPSMDTVAFRSWEDTETRLSALKFDTVDISSLRAIVSQLIGQLRPDYFLGRFGPGMVSETEIRDSIDKLEHLSTDRKLEYVFGRSRPKAHTDHGFATLRAMGKRGCLTSAVSRLKFVPKDITKSRSICMEPNAYMYFQQEVLRWMVAAMEGSPIRRFVSLSDQTNNQRAAIHGSIYLSSDTLDLSSASDSVHVDLVKGVFPRDWLFYMLGTRTSQTRTPSGEIRTLRKFAPMGSAICFPTQCIIFTAVCLYAYEAVLRGGTTGDKVLTDEDVVELLDDIGTVRSDSSPFRKRLEPPVVYGDDIIVDSRATSIVISTLERLGFQVNVAKSFTGSQSIRESCGVYAFKGEDVTPTQFLLPFFTEGKWDAKVYASLIGGINIHRRNGYHNVAAYLQSVLEGYGFTNPIPYVEDPSSFGVHVAKKRQVPGKFVRWNANIQEYEELVQGIGPRTINKRTYDDVYRYDQWWRSRIGDVLAPILTGRSSIRPQETRLVPLWARYEL